MKSVSLIWGSTAEERELSFACDSVISQPDEVLFRGITINAPAAMIFRWLCQMRVAPYSYDWLDNGGRQSPRELTPGLDDLARGQRVMRIFELVDFSRDRDLTIRMKRDSSASRTFGDIAVSYTIIRKSPESCRLVVKLNGKWPRGFWGKLMRAILPWGDLIMMRRQLLNLKALAEQSPSTV